MKFTAQTLIVLLAATSCEAFSVGTLPRASVRQGITSMRMADGEQTDIQALRAAAAKARQDAERLRAVSSLYHLLAYFFSFFFLLSLYLLIIILTINTQEIGESSPAATATPVIPKKSTEEVKSIVPALLAETDVEKQAAGWQELKESKSVQAFGSANLRSFPVGLQMLEQRTGLTPASLGLDEGAVDLDDFKYATLWVTGGCSVVGIGALAFLPPNIGATVCYLVALIPILFLAIGSTAPVIIANAIASLKGGSGSAGDDGVSAQDRICRHEAAHFCCGYWSGLPIAGYSVEEGAARVEFAVASNQYSSTEVAALSVTALAGLVGEAAKWEKVLPGTGTADLMQLEDVFRKSSDFLGAAAQQDLTRWGALTATLLLRQNAQAYEKVVEAFARQAPLEECIALLEE